MRLYSNQEEIKATISIPLKDVVYEEFISEASEDITNTKAIVLDRLSEVRERTKRSRLVKAISEEANVSTRSISRYVKELGEEGQANVKGGWVYPLQ